MTPITARATAATRRVSSKSASAATAKSNRCSGSSAKLPPLISLCPTHAPTAASSPEAAATARLIQERNATTETETPLLRMLSVVRIAPLPAAATASATRAKNVMMGIEKMVTGAIYAVPTKQPAASGQQAVAPPRWHRRISSPIPTSTRFQTPTDKISTSRRFRVTSLCRINCRSQTCSRSSSKRRVRHSRDRLRSRRSARGRQVVLRG